MKKSAKKIIAVSAIAVFVAGIATAAVLLLNNGAKDDKTPAESAKIDTVALSNENYVGFGEGFTDVKVTDESSAVKAVATVADTLGIADAEQELRVTDTASFDGETYYRMQQYYQGSPVYGRSVVLVADEQGTAVSLSANTAKIDRSAKTEPIKDSGFDYDRLLKMAEAVLQDEQFAITNFTCDTLPETVWHSLDGKTLRACVKEIVSFDAPNKRHYSFEVLFDRDSYDVVSIDLDKTYAGRNVTASGRDTKGERREFSAYRNDENEYVMWDEARNMAVYNANNNTLVAQPAIQDGDENLYIIKNGKLYDEDGTEVYLSDDGESIVDENGSVLGTDLMAGFYCYGEPEDNITISRSNSSVWTDAKAVSAISRVQNVYDFYDKVLGRKGFGGADSESALYIYYNDALDGDTTNAYSSTFDNVSILSFGVDNPIEYDVVGHEFTHSVLGSIVDLPYSGETGAINEAYADIFGEITEDYVDGRFNNSNNWVVGGRRSVSDPASDGNPVVYKDSNWSTTFSIPDILKGTPLEIIDVFTDNGGVHSNCTVLSHAAYLMNQGIDGREDYKIDTETLGKIWYKSMFSLHSDETFTQCAAHVYQAALRTRGLTRAQLSCVREAFDRAGLSVEDSFAVFAQNGASLFVLDKNGSRYSNYHLVVRDANNGAVLSEADVNDDKGYPLALEAGTYVLTVSDKAGSKAEYVQRIVVVPDPREGDAYINLLTDY